MAAEAAAAGAGLGMWGTVALAGGSLLGGVLGSSSAKKAAKQQADAARDAMNESRRQFEQTRSDQAQFMVTGQLANRKLRDLLGLGTSPLTRESALVNMGGGAPSVNMELYESSPEYRAAWDDVLSQHVRNFGGGFTGASDGSAIENAIRARLESSGAFNAPQQASEGGGTVGELLRNFTGEDLQNEPGFQFGLSQGEKAIENAARARGMSMSPATVKELLRYGQDYAGTKFNDAFNRDMASRTTKFNFLTGTSGGGQQAAQTVGNAGQNMATNVGNLITGAANARGAAGIAGTNALTGGITGAINNYQQQSILDELRKRNNGGWTPTTNWWGAQERNF